jgi:hypothetical protein
LTCVQAFRVVDTNDTKSLDVRTDLSCLSIRLLRPAYLYVATDLLEYKLSTHMCAAAAWFREDDAILRPPWVGLTPTSMLLRTACIHLAKSPIESTNSFLLGRVQADHHRCRLQDALQKAGVLISTSLSYFAQLLCLDHPEVYTIGTITYRESIEVAIFCSQTSAHPVG